MPTTAAKAMSIWTIYIVFELIILCLIYCEFVADYVKLIQCFYPNIDSKTNDDLNGLPNEDDVLHAMIIADTHILGPVKGHWFDKLYREWHMHRAFQAANTIFHPEVIFILGDLFDEGDLINQEQFQEHFQRFQRHFHTNPETIVVSAAGNHDIGFHYRLHPYFTDRFEDKFNNTGVNLYTIKGIHFVVINSMAMENDGCFFCENAISDLEKISKQLKCLKNADRCDDKNLLKTHGSYSAPIIMQHFPTYRPSDMVCLQHDAPKMEMFREKWEVLSKDSTDLLGNLLEPRLAFAGHSHHYCSSINRMGIPEYTVASFNWRNKIHPSFLLARLTPTQYAVSKCDMLPQDVVFNVYWATAAICLFLSFLKIFIKIKQH